MWMISIASSYLVSEGILESNLIAWHAIAENRPNALTAAAFRTLTAWDSLKAMRATLFA